ncbi:MAG: hypothetical protein H6839_02980 [Planctomycetes bacterium]|nr:hypothetical protein [Planctomycetota bacterium]
MHTRIWASAIVLALAAGVVAIGGIASGQDASEPESVTFVDTEENTLGKEIWGTWVMDDDLTKRTAHEVPKDGMVLEFKSDEDSKGRIKKALEAAVKKAGDSEGEEAGFIRRAAQGVFCTGRLIIKRGERKDEVDFAQVCMWGEPVLLVLESDGEKTDWESVRVSFVRDPDGDNDLLFVGGDHKDEPYVAFKRQEK